MNKSRNKLHYKNHFDKKEKQYKNYELLQFSHFEINKVNK